MNELIYRGIIERMVTEEAREWFLMEEAEPVKVHTPRVHHINAGAIYYRVLVEYTPHGCNDSEAAILDIKVNENGAIVQNEKRTDGGTK